MKDRSISALNEKRKALHLAWIRARDRRDNTNRAVVRAERRYGVNSPKCQPYIERYNLARKLYNEATDEWNLFVEQVRRIHPRTETELAALVENGYFEPFTGPPLGTGDQEFHLTQTDHGLHFETLDTRNWRIAMADMRRMAREYGR